MATGNTITIGGKIERRDTSNFTGGGSNIFNKNKDPYAYGSVLSVNVDRSITYRPIEDNISGKVGKAVPLFANNIQLPVPGDIVPILKGPSNTVGEIKSQYERVTYYLNPITVNQNVNDNTSIPTEGLGSGNGDGGPNTNVNSYNNNDIGLQSTKVSKQEISNNQVVVRDYFKSLGLNKEITAGIMGNIQAECGFNPTEGYDDTNGYTSYGLIQWNAKYFNIKKLATPPSNTPLINHQLDHITNGFTSSYPDFLKKANQTNPLTADLAAYLFAAKVERCYGCTEGIEVYRAGKGHERGTFSPGKRSRYANDFYNRFNDPNDPLYWT